MTTKWSERPCSGTERGRENINEGIKPMNQNQLDNATAPRSVVQQQACSAGAEREILVTIYSYEHDSAAVNVNLGHVMRDLNCSFYSPCELKQRFFTIGTDAYATDAECVERFIAALKASGINIGKHEWSTLPNV